MVEGLENKLIWLQANAQNGGSYVIELNSDEKITDAADPTTLLSRSNSEVTITLKGVGANRAISYAKSSFLSYCPLGGSMFVVGTGTTFVLDNNITLKKGICDIRMVEVRKGGTFVMNEGSAIIGGRSRNGGGGVYVSGGTFLMKGGTISGNTSYRPYSIGAGQAAGKYFMATNEELGGGGVWVGGTFIITGGTSGTFIKTGGTITNVSGTFIKTGGTITNNLVEDIRKELLVNSDRGFSYEIEIRVSGCNGMLDCSKFIDEKGYTSVNGFGSQIYFDGPNPKAIDNTVVPEITLHFSNGILREGRNEESKETTIQTDE
jgi:hypothetical protein